MAAYPGLRAMRSTPGFHRPPGIRRAVRPLVERGRIVQACKAELVYPRLESSCCSRTEACRQGLAELPNAKAFFAWEYASYYIGWQEEMT
jgi:hypothetical protein